jgi:hypothetical protein
MHLGKRLSRVAVLVLSLTVLSACGTRYIVRDPSTGAEYYTTDVDDVGKAGAVRFKDERTGSVVTLTTSEVRKVSRERYAEGIQGAR